MKRLISNILCSGLIGRIVFRVSRGKIKNVRYRNTTFEVPVAHCSYMIVSSIFWGFYEAAETRLLKKYLPRNIPVIELGSSLGVVSSFAISKLDKTSLFIGIEANEKIFRTIETNINQNNAQACSYHILNKAISYSSSLKYLHTSTDSTHSYLVNEQLNSSDIPVQCARLIDIVKEYNLNEYTLISDIEGAEIGIMLKDEEALSKCSSMIIELHETEFEGKSYYLKDVVEIIKSRGFDLLDKDGNVFYFLRSTAA